MSISENDDRLERFARNGVLPMRISRMGIEDEPLVEVIVCDSISGGAAYENDMPAEVTLSRKLADGTVYHAVYVQIEECFQIKKV